MAGPALDLGLEGGRWQLYRDPPRPPPVGVAVEGNGGDALSDSKSNRVTCTHVPVLLYSFEVYPIDSSKSVGDCPEVLNLNRLFLKLNRFISN